MRIPSVLIGWWELWIRDTWTMRVNHSFVYFFLDERLAALQDELSRLNERIERQNLFAGAACCSSSSSCTNPQAFQNSSASASVPHSTTDAFGLDSVSLNNGVCCWPGCVYSNETSSSNITAWVFSPLELKLYPYSHHQQNRQFPSPLHKKAAPGEASAEVNE